MKFEEPYSQYIGKWFYNSNLSLIKYYILNVEDMIELPGKIAVTSIHFGRINGLKIEYREDWPLKPEKHSSSKAKRAIRIIFK